MTTVITSPKPTSLRTPLIKDEVQLALEQVIKDDPSYQIVSPTEEEIQHVSVMFKNRKLDSIDVINYQVVSEIAKNEFASLNTQLKNYTSKISEMKSPGLFFLLDELTKKVNDSDLDSIWEKTVNAKPSLKARFLSLFNPSAINASLQEQYRNVCGTLTDRSKGIEAKLSEIERKLINQKHDQENNIKALNNSFEMYFNSFQEIRQQYIFVLYLEQFYKQELDKYKAANENHQELNVSKKLSEYETVLTDIENKRLILHTSLIKFPLTVKQNENLIIVCKNILKEIDNTLTSNFTSIRSNLFGLGVALNAQQGMLGTNQAKLLDEQSSRLANKITADLTIKAHKFAGESRLAEARTIKEHVLQIGLLNDQIALAKEQNKANIEEASQILNETSQELLKVIGKG